MKNAKFILRIIVFLLLVIETTNNSFGQKAFPDAIGFGAKCKGAYAGSKTPKILIVDTLCNASTGNELTGRGSFRWAASRSYPRIIIFEISGYIDLQSAINIFNPYVTIAGQTAPSPGITFRYYPIEINTHDAIVQHLRFRLGDLTAAAGSFDAFSVYSGPNTYIDHCSFSWAIDENISCSSKDLVKNVTISNCIISEALYLTPNPNSPNAYGMLLYKGDSISIMNNLFANLGDRAPMINNTANDILIVNNLLFNTGCSNANIYFNTNAVQLRASAVGNTFIRGPNATTIKIIRVKEDLATGSKIYLEDNEDIGRTDDPWSVVTGEKIKFRTNTRAVWDKNFIPVSSLSLEKHLLPIVGARPLDRDLVDKRIIDQVVNRNSKMIDSQNDVGGYPVLAQNKRSLQIPANPHTDNNSNGYTNLEDWLYQLHLELIGEGDLGNQVPPYDAPYIYIDPQNTEDLVQNGSPEHPFDSWKDISWKAGRTYLQKSGTVANEDKITISADQVSLSAYGEGTSPVINSTSNDYAIQALDKTKLRISNLHLIASNAVSCVYMLGSAIDSLSIEKCIFEGADNGIRMMEGENLKIGYSKFKNTGDGIYAFAHNSDIYYNVFAHNNTAINIEGQSSKASIFNNVFYDNDKAISVSNVEFTTYNNIFYLLNKEDLAITTQSGTFVSDNNLFYPEQNGFIKTENTEFNLLTELQSALGIEMNSKATDPLFRRSSEEDFGVTNESPAIDAGRDVGIKIDYFDNSVPKIKSPDIGIEEKNVNASISGILEKDSENALSVFPNPSTGKFTIFFNSELPENSYYEVLNSSGNQVHLDYLGAAEQNSTKSLNLESIVSKGIYYLILHTTKEVLTRKLVIF